MLGDRRDLRPDPSSDELGPRRDDEREDPTVDPLGAREVDLDGLLLDALHGLVQLAPGECGVLGSEDAREAHDAPRTCDGEAPGSGGSPFAAREGVVAAVIDVVVARAIEAKKARRAGAARCASRRASRPRSSQASRRDREAELRLCPRLSCSAEGREPRHGRSANARSRPDESQARYTHRSCHLLRAGRHRRGTFLDRRG